MFKIKIKQARLLKGEFNKRLAKNLQQMTYVDELEEHSKLGWFVSNKRPDR